MKWTYRKLISEMRRAGWISYGQGTYRHVDRNRTVELFSYDRENGRELWHRYAEANEVP